MEMKRKKRNKLNLEDEFLLFMMRLKLGLTVIDLSFRFNIAESSVSTIITTWDSLKHGPTGIF